MIRHRCRRYTGLRDNAAVLVTKPCRLARQGAASATYMARAVAMRCFFDSGPVIWFGARFSSAAVECAGAPSLGRLMGAFRAFVMAAAGSVRFRLLI